MLIREETRRDARTRETILDACFGGSRHLKTAERLRQGRSPAQGLALAAEEDGRLVGSLRLWHVTAGPDRPALLLGPLAVDPHHQGRGIGADLMREALRKAALRGHRAVLLVGDAPYYGRFGFSTAATGRLWLPGPFDRGRLLGLELEAGALDNAHGLIAPAGRLEAKPDVAGLCAAASREAHLHHRRAA